MKNQTIGRILVGIVVAALILAACAVAEQSDSFFARLEGVEWCFTSGAGGWSTDMRILPDGAFGGEYHDSEMGEAADDYPNGTVYGCSFTGRMSLVEQLDEDTWKLRVDELTVEQTQEAIDDGIRFVHSDPYGISEGDEMLLYRPGTPVSGFTEDMRFWAHLLGDDAPSELEYWFLYSSHNESGFVGIPDAFATGLANPWEDVTAERLAELSGLTFGVPEDAEDVIYRWLDDEQLAEMQFALDSDEYCARAQRADLSDGELMEISGMYFDWENEEEVAIGGCPGTIGQAQTGSEEWVERCLWYDEEAGIMYSLAVHTVELDGLDLTAVAEQVCGAAVE